MNKATPEFINEEDGSFTLVSNHFIGVRSGLEMSIAFNKARIAFVKAHLPETISLCVLFYDIRGQAVSNSRIDELRNSFAECDVRILS